MGEVFIITGTSFHLELKCAILQKLFCSSQRTQNEASGKKTQYTYLHQTEYWVPY